MGDPSRLQRQRLSALRPSPRGAFRSRLESDPDSLGREVPAPEEPEDWMQNLKSQNRGFLGVFLIKHSSEIIETSSEKYHNFKRLRFIDKMRSKL
jgi:hypothetical protein